MTSTPVPVASGAETDKSGTEGVVGALVALAVGVGAAALVDFGGIAGQGVVAGRFLLALAPFVLVLRSRPIYAARRLQGAIPIGWVLLMAGALGEIIPFLRINTLWAAATALQGVGAAVVLIVLSRSGHFGLFGLFVRLALGAMLGAGMASLATRPLGMLMTHSTANVLVAAYLVPQLVHDFGVVMWGWRTGEWDRVRASLQGATVPFVLWTLAGHLVVAPAILYWSPKPEVLVGGFGAGVALLLLGLRGVAGLFSGRAAVALIVIAVLYGVGLAVLVTGGRPY